MLTTVRTEVAVVLRVTRVSFTGGQALVCGMAVPVVTVQALVDGAPADGASARRTSSPEQTVSLR